MLGLTEFSENIRYLNIGNEIRIQRKYPFATSFVDDTGSCSNFNYTGHIDEKLLVTEAGDSIIVKFTTRYSEIAHCFLARAPNLRAVNDIPGGWRMVVMDYSKYTQLADYGLTLKLRDHTRLAIKDKVRDIIEGLHAKGLVHGDIRRPNILVTLGNPEGVSVQLIDFDWAVPTGYQHSDHPPTSGCHWWDGQMIELLFYPV
jgi:serine/threonine protein kinase